MVVPGNRKSAVDRPHPYDPDTRPAAPAQGALCTRHWVQDASRPQPAHPLRIGLRLGPLCPGQTRGGGPSECAHPGGVLPGSAPTATRASPPSSSATGTARRCPGMTRRRHPFTTTCAAPATTTEPQRGLGVTRGVVRAALSIPEPKRRTDVAAPHPGPTAQPAPAPPRPGPAAGPRGGQLRRPAQATGAFRPANPRRPGRRPPQRHRPARPAGDP